MKANNKIKISKIAFICALGLISAHQASAATLSIAAKLHFDTALTLTKNADIDFKSVSAGVADTYTISTAGAVTAAGSGHTIAGTPVAGSITIAGSSSQAISISVGSFVPDSGVTLSSPTCKYGTGSEAACSTLTSVTGPGTGTTLLLGISAAADGTQTAGTDAAPSETVTVVYN